MRRVRVTTVVWKTDNYQIIGLCACMLTLVIRYENCIFYAPYYILDYGLYYITIIFHVI